MTIEEFRAAIKREFGSDLQYATPANVREFLDDMSMRGLQDRLFQRFELRESKTTYEGILRDFFVRVLDRPKDDALILLWTMAFELSFSMIEVDVAERLGGLFGDND